MPASFTVLADLDGTLLPRPHGFPLVMPPLSQGPAYAPLCRLLDLGVKVIGVTGSRLETHGTRWYAELPERHRAAGRVLLAVETGRRLFRGSSADGSPVEDDAFGSGLARRVPPFDEVCANMHHHALRLAKKDQPRHVSIRQQEAPDF